MARGNYEASPKKLPKFSWLLFILIIAVMLIGREVTAYLSVFAPPSGNQFTVAAQPQITVTDDYCIKVENPQYAVFLRANVLVTWKNTENENQLSEMPKNGKDYELTLAQESNWLLHSDGFYYYKEEVQSNTVTDPIISFNALTEKEGYNLSIQIIAQSIQAAGKIDDGTKTASEDAWGIDVLQIISDH